MAWITNRPWSQSAPIIQSSCYSITRSWQSIVICSKVANFSLYVWCHLVGPRPICSMLHMPHAVGKEFLANPLSIIFYSSLIRTSIKWQQPVQRKIGKFEIVLQWCSWCARADSTVRRKRDHPWIVSSFESTMSQWVPLLIATRLHLVRALRFWQGELRKHNLLWVSWTSSTILAISVSLQSL